MGRDRERAEDSLRRESLVIIRAVEANLRATLSLIGRKFPSSRIVEEVGREPSIDRILLFDDQGNIVASSAGHGTPEKGADISSLILLLKEKA